MKRRPNAPALAALGLLSLPLPAHADLTARLVYVRAAGAESCPDEGAVHAALAARLGHDPLTSSAAATILVEVAPAAGRYVADVQLVDANGIRRGTRHLETGTDACAEVLQTLALTISIAVESLALPPTAPPAQSTPSPPPAVDTQGASAATKPALALSTPLPSPSPSSKDSSSSRPRGFAGLGVLLSLGTAPAPSVGGDAFLGLRWRMASFEAEARGELPASAQESLGTVQSWRVMGSLVGCLRPAIALACVVGGAAWIRATSLGGRPRVATALVGAVGARAGVELPLGEWIGLRAYGEVLGAIGPPTLQINGIDVFPYPPVSLDAGMAALMSFQ